MVFDLDYSDEDLKFHLIKTIGTEKSYSFQGSLVGSSSIDLKDRPSGFSVKDSIEEKKLKSKLGNLIWELILDGYVILDVNKEQSNIRYILTEKAVKLYNSGKLNDMKALTDEFINETNDLLEKDIWKEYFKEAYICFKDRRLIKTPIFLLGAISEGIIFDFLYEYKKITPKLSIPPLKEEKNLSKSYTKFIMHYTDNKVAYKIYSQGHITSEQKIKLDELNVFLTFFFNIYRVTRNNIGHLHNTPIKLVMIKTSFQSFKEYVNYIKELKVIFKTVI